MNNSLKVLMLCLMFSFLLISCVSIRVIKYDAWETLDIMSRSGNLEIPDNSYINFFYGSQYIPVVSGVLSSQGCSEDILVVFDTGSSGSYIDEKLLKKFPDSVVTDTKFFFGSVSGEIMKGAGYEFNTLQIGDLQIERPLLCSMNMSSVPISLNGKKVQVIIGMNLLQQTPFFFSNTEKRIYFPKDYSTEGYAEYQMISNEKNPYDGVFKIQLAQFGEKYSFLIDTGSDICYLNEKFVEKEILPISTKIRYRKSILSTRAEGLYENLEFYPNNPSIVAFWQNPMKDNTISYAVLHNFDFIVDFHKKKLYVREVIRSDGLLGDDNDMITYFNRKGSGLSPTFGFSLRESGTRRFVLDRFSDNTKKRYVPQLKFNDELISVNGITLDTIDWTIWYQLDEADFVFRRKGKDFALHLKRQGIEGL